MEKDSVFDGAKAMNKVAMACHIVIVIVLELAYLIEVIKGSRTVGYYILFSAVAILPVLIELVMYRRDPSDLRLKYVIGVTYTLFYVFVVFTTISMVAFTYIIYTALYGIGFVFGCEALRMGVRSRACCQSGVSWLAGYDRRSGRGGYGKL